MILKSKNLTGQPLEDARELIHSEHRKSSRTNRLSDLSYMNQLVIYERIIVNQWRQCGITIFATLNENSGHT